MQNTKYKIQNTKWWQDFVRKTEFNRIQAIL
jgi:hypothetical protein